MSLAPGVITPGGSVPLEAADAERSTPGLLPLFFLRLTYVRGRVPVDGGDPGEVPRFVGGEGDRELMAALQAGQPPEVGQPLALLLGHVVAVGQVRPRDRAEPLIGTHLMASDLRNCVPDLVVVLDSVE